MKEKYPYESDLDLEKEAPFLASLKGKKLPFETPEGYFDSFADRVMDKVRAESGPASGPAGNSRRNFYYSAAAVLVMLVLFTLSARWSSQREQATDLSQLSSEEIMLALDVHELDEEVLIEAMGDEALAAFDEYDHLSDETISEYFQEEEMLDEIEFNFQDEDLEWLDENFIENEI